jgi:hypothetical protein
MKSKGDSIHRYYDSGQFYVTVLRHSMLWATLTPSTSASSGKRNALLPSLNDYSVRQGLDPVSVFWILAPALVMSQCLQPGSLARRGRSWE